MSSNSLCFHTRLHNNKRIYNVRRITATRGGALHTCTDTHEPAVFKTTANTYSRTNPMSVCCVFSCLHFSVNHRTIRHETWSHIKGVITFLHHNSLWPVMRTAKLGFPSSSCWCLSSGILTAVVPHILTEVSLRVLCLSSCQSKGLDPLL